VVEVDEMAKYLTVEEAASALDVPESRFRASWRQAGIVRPALSKGLQQLHRADVVRGAVVVCLQRVFGDASTLALSLAKALTPTQLDSILVADVPQVEAEIGAYGFKVTLDPDYMAAVREKIAQVRR
jgi:hypothetical protein